MEAEGDMGWTHWRYTLSKDPTSHSTIQYVVLRREVFRQEKYLDDVRMYAADASDDGVHL